MLLYTHIRSRSEVNIGVMRLSLKNLKITLQMIHIRSGEHSMANDTAGDILVDDERSTNRNITEIYLANISQPCTILMYQTYRHTIIGTIIALTAFKSFW